MDLPEVSWNSAMSMLKEEYPEYYDLFEFENIKEDAFVWTTDNFRLIKKISKFRCFREDKKIAIASIQKNGKVTLYEIKEFIEIGDHFELKCTIQKKTLTFYVRVVEYYPKQSFNMIIRTAAVVVVIDEIECS